MAAWCRMYFLFSLRFGCEVSNHVSGLLLVLSLKSVPVDLMGTSHEFQRISSWMDENVWLFDKMLFFLINNMSLCSQECSATH